MACRECASGKQKNFTAEIAVHFPGLENLDRPHVFVFPELLVCLKCGKAEFNVPETELRKLTMGGGAASE
jgi:hypothetical protein